MPATADLDWETLPAPVRDFLSTVSDGVTIRRNGSPVRRVIAFAPPMADDGEWTPAKNNRRCDLIDLDIAGTITPEELAELDDLTEQMRRYVDRVAPLPLDGARKLLEELPALAAAKQAC